jgi:inorganic triphosphatase YgiF
MADYLEIEQKYEADAGFTLPALDGLPGIARVDGPHLYHLEATYFDTEDLALSQNKITLRRRTGGEDAGWHLKLPAGSARKEVREPLGSAAEVPLRLSSQVAALTEDRPLHPLATLKTERTVRRLFDDSGTLLVEVADDHVTARRLSPPGAALSWREIEAEAGPDVTDAAHWLTLTGRLLLDAGARPARSGSKLAHLLNASG